jgi:hypothetical protein
MGHPSFQGRWQEPHAGSLTCQTYHIEAGLGLSPLPVSLQSPADASLNDAENQLSQQAQALASQ